MWPPLVFLLIFVQVMIANFLKIISHGPKDGAVANFHLVVDRYG
jgi:hypothetical protein